MTKKLKEKLLKLGYTEDFTDSSVDLISHLLDDLLQTSESCRKLKVNFDEKSQQFGRLSSQIDGFKSECSKLTVENNQLHVHLINASDQRDELSKKSQLAARKLENEIADLRFLNKQLTNRFEGMQRRGEAERLRLDKILDIVGNAASRDINAEFLKSASGKNSLAARVDIETGLAELKLPPTALPHVVPLCSVDMMVLMEAKIEKSRQETVAIASVKTDLEAQISTLESQIKTRDEEIVRLGQLLEVERAHSIGYHYHSPSKEPSSAPPGSSTRSTHLESQLAYLHDSVAELEKSKSVLEREKAILQSESSHKISLLSDELKSVQDKNENLCLDLKHLESLVHELEKSRGIAPKKSAIPKRTTTEQPRKPLNPARVEAVYDEVTKLRRELLEKKKRTDELQTQLTDFKERYAKLQESYSETREELLATNKTLVQSQQNMQEILRLHPYINAESTTAADREPSPEYSLDSPVAVDDTSNKELATEMKKLKQKLETSRGLEKELEKSQKLIGMLQSQISNLNTKLKKLHEQIDAANDGEIEAVSHMHKVEADLEAANAKIAEQLHQIEELKLEATDLKGAIDDAVLEKDSLAKLYVQLNTEHQSLMEREAKWKAKINNQSAGKLDDSDAMFLKSECERLTCDNDKLQEQISTLNDKLQEDDEQRTGELKVRLQKLEETCETMRDTIVVKEKHIEELSEHAAEKEAQIVTLESEISRLLDKLEAQEQELVSAKNQLSEVRNSETIQQSGARDQRRQLEEFDKERDLWQHEIDTKTELIAELQAAVDVARSAVASDKAEVDNLRNEISVLKTQALEQEREISSISAQLEEAFNDKQTLQEAALQLQEANRNLQADLSSVVHETQTLQHELSDMAQQRQHLQESLEQKHQQQTYLEQLVAGKDSDKEQLMMSYRKLVQDHNELENQFASTKAKCLAIGQDLEAKERQLSQVYSGAESHADEVERLRADLVSSQQQILQLKESSIRLETMLHQRETQSSRADVEMASIRDLVHSLQRSKDHLASVHAKTVAELENTRKSAHQLEREKSAIMSELNSCKTKLERLETLLAQERTENFKSKTAVNAVADTNAKMEEKVTELNEIQVQRSASFAALSEELKTVEAKNQLLNERIQSLEAALAEQNEALKLADEDQAKLRQIIEGLKSTNQSTNRSSIRSAAEPHEGKTELDMRQALEENIFSSPARASYPETPDAHSISSPSLLEQKVMDELDSTKKQLKRFEELISKRTRSFPVFDLNSNMAPAFATQTSTSRLQSTSGNDAAVAKELLKTWKVQNEAMRNVLRSIAEPEHEAAQGTGGVVTSTPLAQTRNGAPRDHVSFRPSQSTIQIRNNQDTMQHAPSRNSQDTMHQAASRNNQKADDPSLRNSLDASERRRRMLELENQKILSVVAQVRDDLKLARSPPQTAASPQ